MSTAAITQALRNPGALYEGVTAVSGSAPYGGTALGLVAGVQLRNTMLGGRAIRAHEFSGLPVQFVGGVEAWELRFLIRGRDDDALNSAFWDTTKPGSNRLIKSLTSSGGAARGSTTSPLLFAPLNAGGMAVLFLAAIASAVPSQLTVRLSAATEVVWDVVYTAVPRATDGRYVEVGRLADMAAP